MSINVEEFARNILLEAPDDTVSFAHARQRQSLWNIYGAVEHQEVTALATEITLDENTANVTLVLWNKSILYRTDEAVLDALDNNWRQATPGIPRNYVYRGEENLQRLRLHPRPSANGRLQVIKQIQPASGVAHWYSALLALLVIHQLSISDMQRQRPDVAKTLQPIMEYIINGTKTGLIRRR